GLSYTEFDYSEVKIDKTEITQGEPVNVSVIVKNTGNYDGEEVVQLYLKDVVRSITPPVKQLKGFRKVFLKKGETKTVTLTLAPDDLKFYNSQLEFVSEPGVFEVFVGTNAADTQKASFRLKAE
ncbi:MAG: fibronectin type III-like domain-contianing protein, partial [Aurantibacter sp.]